MFDDPDVMFQMSALPSTLRLIPDSSDSANSDPVTVTVRARGDDVDAQMFSTELLRHLEQTPHATRCAVHVMAGSSLDATLSAMTGASGTGLGWEAALFPESNPSSHRAVRPARAMPKGYSLMRGTSLVSPEHLSALHRRSATELASPHLVHADSFRLIVDGDVCGWIPVQRLSPTTVTFRAVLHDAQLYCDEPRRRSFLRLSAWSQAVSTHLGEGSTIITWMPDNGDPINEYKLKVAQPDWLVHWVRHVIELDALERLAG